MASQPVSIRTPETVRAEIEEAARRSRRDFSSVANEMLGEAIRMRRVPGIVFLDSPSGRSAAIAGTGLEVWELVETFRAIQQDLQRLHEIYDHLSDAQIHAALSYAAAYPDEIDALIADNATWTPERVWSAYPVTRPPGR